MCDKTVMLADYIPDLLMEKIELKEPPNGGYGWVVVAASFMVHFIVIGNINSFGVFFPVYIDVFNAPQGSVAWVGSIGTCLMTGLGAYTGILADKYGNGKIVALGSLFIAAGFLLASYSTELWHLYVTQGFIAGIGYSLSFISGISVVNQWFTTKRGLAVGLAMAGSGIGQFAISQTIGKLLIQFKWRTTLRILALIFLVVLLLCSVLIRRFAPCTGTSNSATSTATSTTGDNIATGTTTSTPTTSSKPSQSDMHLLKDRNFLLLSCSAILSALGLFMPYTHLTKYAEIQGMSSSAAILILSIMGLSGAVGQASIGFLADLYGSVLMLSICLVVSGASTLAWMACVEFQTLMVYGVVYGYFAGASISLYPTVCGVLYSIEHIGTVVGVLYSGTAIGNLLSAPIAGFLYDATHQYYASISVAGGLLLLSTVSLFFLKITKQVACTTASDEELGEGGEGDARGALKGVRTVEEKMIDGAATVALPLLDASTTAATSSIQQTVPVVALPLPSTVLLVEDL